LDDRRPYFMNILLSSQALRRAALLAAAGGILPAPARAQPSAGDAAPADAAPEIGTGLLPDDLSIVGMFLGADIVVQAIIVGLLFASVLTWTVWLAKTIEIRAARRRVAHGLSVLARAPSLDKALAEIEGSGPVATIVRAAESELRLSPDAADADGIKERIVSHFARIELAAGRHMTRGTAVLATIGATAPFVGLFGTVWGIMNSFIGISKAQTTNLAVVAPGIAEALLATAIGLVAAIPAVVIYNAFARSIATYRASVGDAAAAALRLVSRDLDRGRFPFAKAAE
jgi:biopolymer transport protein ExbB